MRRLTRSIPETLKRGGGTGQALRIAEHHKIPIFDLALPDTPKLLCAHVARLELENQKEYAP